jgi:hypothetical protein
MADIKAWAGEGTPQWKNSSSKDPRPTGVRRRQRQTLSCLPCRRLKVKCDREQPCGHCVWSERASSCRYAAFPPATTNSRSSTDRSSSDGWTTLVKGPKSPNRRSRAQPSLLPQTLAPHHGDQGTSDSATLSTPAYSKRSDASPMKEDSLEGTSPSFNPHAVWKSKYRSATHWVTVARQVSASFISSFNSP